MITKVDFGLMQWDSKQYDIKNSRDVFFSMSFFLSGKSTFTFFVFFFQFQLFHMGVSLSGKNITEDKHLNGDRPSDSEVETVIHIKQEKSSTQICRAAFRGHKKSLTEEKEFYWGKCTLYPGPLGKELLSYWLK